MPFRSRSTVALGLIVGAASIVGAQQIPSAPTNLRIIGIEPVIWGVTAAAVTSSQATISWSTDLLSDSQVEYGLTTAYGSVSGLNPTLVIAHVMTISGLAGGQVYHFRVHSRDAMGNRATSPDFTFTTPGGTDSTDPSVTITSPASGASVTGTTAVSASANDNIGVAGVQFKVDGVNLGAEDTSAPYSVSWNTTATTNGAHTLSAVARDAAGNTAVSTVSVTVSNDLTAPQISGVAASSVTASGATITWTTNEASDSQVQYGTSTAYGSTTPVNGSMVTVHTAALGGLSASTVYHYRVRSRDAAGNLATSADFTFTTPAPPDTTQPTVSITAPAGGATVSSAITVSANAGDNVGVAGVQFKLDGANLGAEDTTAPYAVVWNTAAASNGSHSLTAVARDAAGNTAASAAVTVTVANTTTTVLTLSPVDTSLNLNATNFSTATTLTTYTWPDQRVANAILMKFDLAALPPGAVVQDATLQLALVETDASTDATYSIGAHKVVGKNPVIPAATGYTFDGVTPWTANACCSNNVPLAQADISAAYDTKAIDKTLGFKSWNVTALVEEWAADPVTNFGLLLNSDASKLADRYRFFASMEHADPALRPSLRITYTVPPPDPTPPTVSMTAPAAGASVSGTVTVSATAADNIGVASVQFQLDGLDLGAKDTTAPYSISWNTTAVTAGPHTLRAVARDLAGNTTTSAAVTVTVLDITAPTVSITAPGIGTTVAGTVSVAATASDVGGVAGVQFKLDGANLGAEDTSAPYSLSWNTTGVSDGSHTLTAVARDGAGNVRTSAAITVSVANSSGSTGGIATLYPGDVGIESHPDVVFTEMFEQSSISTMASRYNDVAHGAGMTFSTSKPTGSLGTRSLQMSTNGTTNEAAGLYKTFPDDQVWYLRYYINYNSAVEYGHTSGWLGGYNPVLSFPNPQAGSKPAGNDRFSTGIEPHAFESDRWMSYTYWKDMRLSGDGKYWGNVFLPSNTALRMVRNRWYCVETMVKLNTPVTDANGELAMWIDGQKILHLGKSFPSGTWSGGTFTENSSGSSFGGFQWRSDPALNLNWIWLQNYVTGVPSTVQYDHVVLARSYIGCLTSSGTSDTTPPTVALTTPAAGASVSGSITVSANASDNVGVAGVQFKLDGANLGAEDTTAPYAVSWDTRSASNGSHTLTAVARDALGNIATSSAAVVTVSNSSSGGILFESNWSTATGNGSTALLDGGKWNVFDVGGGVASNPNEMVVVNTTAPPGLTNSLRIQQQGSGSNAWCRVAKFNFTPQSRDFYLRYYYRTDDVAGTRGSHVVQYALTNYGDLVYLSQLEYAAGWSIRMTLGAYHAPNTTMPNWQMANPTALAYGKWYRIEYWVHFTAVDRIQVYIRIYDDTNRLVVTEKDFIADPDWGQWTGATLASYYAGTNPGSVTDFKVTPSRLVNIEFGNNGSASATNTGLYWYFAGVQIRSDTWPGPIGGTP